MNRNYSYLNSAIQILNQYKGEEPFASFIKKYFSTNKKHGSNDRKQISHLCYCYFRLGKARLSIPTEERILVGLFLCSTEPNEMLTQLKPAWSKHLHLPIQEKLLIIPGNYSLLIQEVFPWQNELSDGIDHGKFCESFFVQPDLFLRFRPGHENSVREKLSRAEVDFKEMNASCLALPNSSKIEDLVELDREAVIQDYNSQQVSVYLKSASLNLIPIAIGTETKAWDCCAGSGGKSILLYDENPKIDLTVSDVRESILVNLRKRFAKAGMEKYKSFVADLTERHSSPDSYRSNLHLPISIGTPFDLIICDAPCTGSGTWSRTPEQLCFFDERKIEDYSLTQKQILSNAIPHLGDRGFFIYITCSVFRKENEENVEFIRQKFNLELVKMEALTGYEKKADTLFAALFKRS